MSGYLASSNCFNISGGFPAHCSWDTRCEQRPSHFPMFRGNEFEICKVLVQLSEQFPFSISNLNENMSQNFCNNRISIKIIFAKIILHYRASALPFTVEIDFFLTHWDPEWHEISNHSQGVRMEAFLFKSPPVNHSRFYFTILIKRSVQDKSEKGELRGHAGSGDVTHY